MKKSRNRLTPILVIILIILIWILAVTIIYKMVKNGTFIGSRKLKLNDDLVQELYSYVTDEDIVLYSNGKYDINSLPSDYIFSKATKFMTIEDIEFLDNNNFIISYESLDGAIKTAFGPDIKYDLSNINTQVKTYIETEEEYKLVLDVKYNSKTKEYYGTYTTTGKKDEVIIKKELVEASKDDYVNLKVGYIFYKYSDNKYKICNDINCSRVLKEVSTIDDYTDYDSYVTISLKKASDEVYYYYKNS